MQGSLPVAWVVPGAGPFVEPPVVPGVEWVVARFDELAGLGWEKPRLRAALVDLGADLGPAELGPVLSACPFPVLVRLPPERLAEVLPALRPGDDVCLPTSPAPLLAHRLSFLSRQDLDPLTGLLNKRAYQARLDDALRVCGPELPLSLVHLNVDHLKALNDARGHEFGDRVLAGCAALLQTGDSVLAARVGGDEFAVLAPGLDEPAALAFARRLCEVFAARPWPDGVRVTASFGVATADAPGMARNAFEERATLGMYEAKSGGRNRVVHFRAMERDAARAGHDIQVRAFEAVQQVVSDRAQQAINLRSRRVMEELQKRADSDDLTGLYDRGYLDRRLPRTCEDARGGAPLSIALLDVDHFGNVNKTHGHPTGDQALRDVADIIRRTVRAEDWVARYGGEEIAVVLNGATCAEAVAVAERVRAAVEGHTFRTTKGAPYRITVSAGVAELRPDETLLQLWDRLSAKVLEAKSEGRNRVRS